MSTSTAEKTDPDHPQPPFQLVKRVQDNIWITRRNAQHSGYADGEEFIARKVDDFDEYYEAGKYSMNFTTKKQRQIKGLMDLLYEHNMGRNISHILNHENIISLAGYLRQQPVHPRVQATEDYLVWDICDAGTLEILFADRHSEREPGCYLPESLCWHVLTSVMRTLVWLHDGYRQEVNWATGERAWAQTDTEWMPILHRNIDAQSIFFQHSRGKETYGVCKLGKFGKAFLSGVPARRDGAPKGETPLPHSIGFPIAPKTGHMRLTEMMGQWKEYLDTERKSKRLYTLSDEHWALGAVLFRMMTGRRLPSLDGCEMCHCIHIRRCAKMGCVENEPSQGQTHKGSRGCEHERFRGCQCVVPSAPAPGSCGGAEADVHVDEVLYRLGYSRYLKVAVRMLLDYDLEAPAVETRGLADRVERLYVEWRCKTEEGREYVDVMDDLGYRFLVLNKAAHELAE
ncbi:hypothetical protein CORC01_10427 [Colletotrichum orchidophilum]|uniref:Protein kinase domain-containing protein n=1 Tax=Colletotrichum orchidophilum TaxID=1209926 RepID=A0A1G4AYP5_9PEZI|nr:uncharacterized protein CORC01_10427 [Colletotrichum orchidophilum]OHE94267.1 hypothetical protein CORC01_10427 [Colletotrichum orchidophilum]